MNDDNGWRTQPLYSFVEAAQLAKVSTNTVRNWLLGFKGRNGENRPPLFSSHDNQGPGISFLQLIEVIVAAKFRKSERVSYQTVYAAYVNAKEIYSLEYPFAHLSLESLGGHIIAKMHGDEPGRSQQVLDSLAQWTLPGLVLETVKQIEYGEKDLAVRWFPVGKDRNIVVDPRISSGIPTIVGRGVTVQAIRKRWKAGHKIDFIAQDLALDANLVETALQYGEQVAA
jgi:uncharacterized protein (DUF433 family)